MNIDSLNIPNHAIRRTNDNCSFPGVFIGLSIPLNVARRVAVKGGSSPEELHVTLAYLGKVDDLTDRDKQPLEELLTSLQEIASDFMPLAARFAGSGRFTGEKKQPAYLGIDAPRLEIVQRVVSDTARNCGFPPSQQHGFTPHMTLAYIASGEAHPLPEPPEIAFDFATLELWLAGERIIFLPQDRTQTLAKAENHDLRGPAQHTLAELAGDRLVLSQLDTHARTLASRVSGQHAGAFDALAEAMTTFHGGPLEDTALHHATEAARARRVADTE